MTRATESKIYGALHLGYSKEYAALLAMTLFLLPEEEPGLHAALIFVKCRGSLDAVKRNLRLVKDGKFKACS